MLPDVIWLVQVSSLSKGCVFSSMIKTYINISSNTSFQTSKNSMKITEIQKGGIIATRRMRGYKSLLFWVDSCFRVIIQVWRTITYWLDLKTYMFCLGLLVVERSYLWSRTVSITIWFHVWTVTCDGTKTRICTVTSVSG